MEKIIHIQKKYMLWRAIAIYTFPVCMTIYFFIEVALGGFSDEQSDFMLNMFMTPALIGAVIAFVVRAIYLSSLEARATETIAKLLGLDYAHAGYEINKNSILLSGSSSMRYRGYGNDNESFMSLSTQYYSDSIFQKDMTVMSSCYVYSIKLPQKFPQIFIDGLGQNMLTVNNIDLWVLRHKLKTSQRIQDLEADFPKRFKVFTAIKHQFRVLSVLTPDVMESIDALGKQVDIEIIDDQLNVIIDRAIIRKRNLPELAHTLQFAVEDIKKQLKLPLDDSKHYQYLDTKIYKLPLIQFMTIGVPMFFYPITLMLLFLPSIIIGGALGLLARVLLQALGLVY